MKKPFLRACSRGGDLVGCCPEEGLVGCLDRRLVPVERVGKQQRWSQGTRIVQLGPSSLAWIPKKIMSTFSKLISSPPSARSLQKQQL